MGTSRNTREIDYKSPIDYRSPTTPQTGRDNSKIGASEIMIKPWQNDQLPNTTDTTLEARNTPDSAEKSK